MTQTRTPVRSLAAALLTSVLCHAGCASDADSPPLEQPVSMGNALPMPGNVNTMLGAGGAGAARPMSVGMAGRSQPMAAAGAAGVSRVGQGGASGQSAAAGSAAAAGASAAGFGAAGASGSQAAAGSSAQAAAGAAGSAAAGSGAPAGTDACGADAMPVMGETSTQGNGLVTIFSSGETEVIAATMTMIVPKKPASNDTLFLWPGIQPSSAGGISGFGVLQPVLTWGDSCNGQNKEGWWISGQYVYFTGGFGGARCEGGDIMTVEIGDKLDIAFELKGKVWTQTVTSRNSGKSVKFDRDLEGQKQVEVLYEIETPTRNKPVDDVIFTSNVIKLSSSQPKACVARSKGAQDYISPARASADGRTCCIDKVILRASGVAATSPNEP